MHVFSTILNVGVLKLRSGVLKVLSASNFAFTCKYQSWLAGCLQSHIHCLFPDLHLKRRSAHLWSWGLSSHLWLCPRLGQWLNVNLSVRRSVDQSHSPCVVYLVPSVFFQYQLICVGLSEILSLADSVCRHNGVWELMKYSVLLSTYVYGAKNPGFLQYSCNCFEVVVS